MQADDFSTRLSERAPTLSRTLRRVATLLDQRRADVLSMSAIELGRAFNTSDASIIRTAKALGYDGLPQLRKAIARSVAPGPAEGFRRTLEESSADALVAAAQSVQSHREQLNTLDEDAMALLNAIARMLNECERIVLFGVGPTAHVVHYGAQLLQRHGRSVLTLDRTGRGLADQMLLLRGGDGILMFAYGEPYPEAMALVDEAAALSLRTALVTDVRRARLARTVEHVALVARGKARGMSFHGLTMVWLEALIVSLSVMDREGTAAALDRLERLRDQ